MQVTRVHFLNLAGGACVYISSTEGYMEKAMPISEAMAKCLAVDIHNQVVNGRGRITPTPWGWQWCSCHAGGRLPVPPKRSEILQDIIVATDTVPLYHLSLLERR